MQLPEPIPTMIRDESFADVTYHIRGQLVPELQVELRARPSCSSTTCCSGRRRGVEIELKKLPGGIKRKIAGLDFFVTLTSAPGRIAFSRDPPGQCIPMHLEHGEGLDVREHQFIAATDNLDYSFERVKGVQNMLLGGSGFFIDKFRATHGRRDRLVARQRQRLRRRARRGRAARRRGRRLAVQGPHGARWSRSRWG